MIARASTAAKFAPLARYLVTGRDGSAPGRVAWTTSRNLPSDDPLLAADLMQATAAQNVRTSEPAYHLALSFAPGDHPTPQLLRQVADRALAELGLTDHQAIVVAHDYRAHAHVHVVVNRVHPDTHTVWDRWRDQTMLQRLLADQERALGVRELPAHDRAVKRASPDPGPGNTARQRDRATERALAERLRTVLPEIRASRTCDELRERLAERDLQIERRAKGLVMTYGSTTIRASALAADASLARLEARLGPLDGERVRTASRSPDPTRTAFHGAMSVAVVSLCPKVS
jgi:Relaxase/Mobilisation nuclease domain